MVDIEPNYDEISRIYNDIHDTYERIESLFIELKKYKELTIEEYQAMRESTYRVVKYGMRSDSAKKKIVE